ncbi:MAG TPA: DoxX family membrane protein [Candidatus Udaeobacter sp.]|nr:DoxX family membrane protein [Candidatus Udaeobacter sp.]
MLQRSRSAKPRELTGFLQYPLQHGYSWYQKFLGAAVIPYGATFGTLVVIAEIYVAIALVFGLTTRLAACVAIFLLLNYLCAKGALP